MDFGSILGQMAVGAGNSLIYGAKYNAQVAETENMKANTAMHKMSVLAQQREIADRSAAATDFKAGMEGAAGTISADAVTVNAARETANKAAQRGDFKTMKAMGDLAKTTQDSMQETVLAETKKVAAVQETASNAAQDYLTNPTPETARKAVTAALLAGVPPEQIPPSTDTAAFTNNMKMQAERAMGSEKRVDFMQKKIETDRLRDEAERHNLNTERATVLAQQSLERDRQNDNALNRMNYDRMVKKDAFERQQTLAKAADTGDEKLTADQKNSASKVAGSVIEGTADLKDMMLFADTERTGVFAGMHGDGALARLSSTGGTLISGSQAEMLRISAGNLGRMALQAEIAVMGGRSPTQAQMDHMQTLVEPKAGDSKYVVQYKLAKTASIFLRSTESVSTPHNPEVAKHRQEAVDFLHTLPTTQQVLKAAQRDPAQLDKIREFNKNFGKGLRDIKAESERIATEGVEVRGTSTSGSAKVPSPASKTLLAPAVPATPVAPASGLPAGWK